MDKMCYIVGAGDNSGTNFKRNENEYVIAADGGLKVLEQLGIEPDFIIGDFDSLGFVPKGENVFKHKAEKDDTDTGLAIKKALELGCNIIKIYGGTKGRVDHTIANIQSMINAANQGAKIQMLDNDNTYTVVSNSTVILKRGSNKYFSVFAMSDMAKGVTIKNAKYPLDNYIMTSDNPIGVSNEYMDEEVLVSVEKGTILIIS